MGAVGPRAVPAPPPPALGSAIRRSAADGSGDCSATLPSVLVLNPGWPHQGEGLTAGDADAPANFDSGPGHLPEEDLEETSAQDPEVLSLGLLGLDTNRAPNWPGLRTLLQQLPPQDGDERYRLALGEEELAELRLFCAQRRREALGQGVACLIPPKLQECTCEKCRERLRPGEYGVFAARAGERPCWHQACFACQAGGQALMNRIYFDHDGHLSCGHHHAELLRPRCPACDQLIFSPRCTEAEGWRWHENHFCCQDCAGPLGGGRYAWPGGGPCCPTCFESRYSDAGWSLAATLEGRPPLAAPPSSNRTPKPELRGPQLSPRIPGRSAPRASRAHPAPRVRLRRGTGSRTGDAAALWWAEAGRGRGARGDQRGGLRTLGAWPVGGRGALAGRGRRPSRICGCETQASEKGLSDPEEQGRRGSRRAEGGDRAPLPSAAVSSSPETQRRLLGSCREQDSPAGDKAEAPRGRGQGPLETSIGPKEDVPCPTCSSSSDSEPEGFFLGQRLPRPCATLRRLQADDSGTSRKRCTVC
ncbi:prickle-like protein 4 [Myotis lucifugus]|uniref:prickle-like protein 4 n=1 Tax=Myotis lucifugus TaxID=59463 RepID=UPI000CCBFF38|nr:prickle-like protein 4 [Myotis lucifugus]